MQKSAQTLASHRGSRKGPPTASTALQRHLYSALPKARRLPAELCRELRPMAGLPFWLSQATRPSPSSSLSPPGPLPPELIQQPLCSAPLVCSPLTPDRLSRAATCSLSLPTPHTSPFSEGSEFTILTSSGHKTTRPCLKLQTSLFSVHFSSRGRVRPRVTVGSRGLSQP